MTPAAETLRRRTEQLAPATAKLRALARFLRTEDGEHFLAPIIGAGGPGRRELADWADAIITLQAVVPEILDLLEEP